MGFKKARVILHEYPCMLRMRSGRDSPHAFRLRIEKMCLYNNQIDACTLIGQLAMGYCASKLMENSSVF